MCLERLLGVLVLILLLTGLGRALYLDLVKPPVHPASASEAFSKLAADLDKLNKRVERLEWLRQFKTQTAPYTTGKQLVVELKSNGPLFWAPLRLHKQRNNSQGEE